MDRHGAHLLAPAGPLTSVTSQPLCLPRFCPLPFPSLAASVLLPNLKSYFKAPSGTLQGLPVPTLSAGISEDFDAPAPPKFSPINTSRFHILPPPRPAPPHVPIFLPLRARRTPFPEGHACAHFVPLPGQPQTGLPQACLLFERLQSSGSASKSLPMCCHPLLCCSPWNSVHVFVLVTQLLSHV